MIASYAIIVAIAITPLVCDAAALRESAKLRLHANTSAVTTVEGLKSCKLFTGTWFPPSSQHITITYTEGDVQSLNAALSSVNSKYINRVWKIICPDSYTAFPNELHPKFGRNLREFKMTHSRGNQNGLPTFRGFPRLSKLDLSNGDFGGDLSKFAPSTNLEELNLRNNLLSGEIGTRLRNHIYLKYVNLGGNQFTGGFENSFTYGRRLRNLQLDRNQLSGTLTYLKEYDFLTELNIEHNEFSGAVPLWSNKMLPPRPVNGPGDPHFLKFTYGHNCFDVPINRDNCMQYAVEVFGEKVGSRRNYLKNGRYKHVPYGCSVQSGGDWAAHWNGKSNGRNSGGKYTKVKAIECKSNVVEKADCLHTAIEQHGGRIRHNELRVGSWDHVPLGCSVNTNDGYRVHYNWRAQRKNFGAPFETVKRSSYSSYMVRQNDCFRVAYLQNARPGNRFNYFTENKVIVGSWDHVPLGCSIRGNDVYFNHKAGTDSKQIYKRVLDQGSLHQVGGYPANWFRVVIGEDKLP